MSFLYDVNTSYLVQFRHMPAAANALGSPVYDSKTDHGNSMRRSRRSACSIAEAMRKKKKTKQALAKELNTSRSQLDRLLDPQNIAVSLDTITRAARALGKRLIIR